jgi:hypothetical protein
VPPSLRISPAVTHRLVDANQNIKAEASTKLQQWHPAQNLGKTMYSIVQKLMQEPPTPGAAAAAAPDSVAPAPAPSRAASQPAHLAAIPTSLQGGAVAYAMESSSNGGGGGGGSKSSVSVPPIPDSFPELQSMKPAQLGELLNDDAAFRKYLLSIDSVKNMVSLRNELRSSAAGGESDTAALDREIAEARDELEQQKKLVASKAAQQEKLMAKLQVANLVDALATLANQSEEESDELSRSFLDGDVDVKAFQRDYVALREVYHLRSAKKESLMIKQQREKAK